MVSHLRGRQLNPSKIEIYRADVSHRLQRLQECSVGRSADLLHYVYSMVCACVSHVCLLVYLFVFSLCECVSLCE